MAFFEKVLKKDSNIDIEEFLNNLDNEDDEEIYENVDAYVKPFSLEEENDVAVVVGEVKKGNFVLLNISGLAKRNTLKLRELIAGLKGQIETIDGDIARISHDRLLVTPSKVKIIKRRESA